jgi:hypothetical protein
VAVKQADNETHYNIALQRRGVAIVVILAAQHSRLKEKISHGTSAFYFMSKTAKW